MNEFMQVNFRIKLIDSFGRNIIMHGQSTSSKLNFHVQFAIQFYFREGVVNMGIKQYNRAPDSVKKFDNFKLYKK